MGKPAMDEHAGFKSSPFAVVVLADKLKLLLAEVEVLSDVRISHGRILHVVAGKSCHTTITLYLYMKYSVV